MSRYGQSDLQVTTKPDMTPVSGLDRRTVRPKSSTSLVVRAPLAATMPNGTAAFPLPGDPLLGALLGGDAVVLAQRCPQPALGGRGDRLVLAVGDDPHPGRRGTAQKPQLLVGVQALERADGGLDAGCVAAWT